MNPLPGRTPDQSAACASEQQQPQQPVDASLPVEDPAAALIARATFRRVTRQLHATRTQARRAAEDLLAHPDYRAGRVESEPGLYLVLLSRVLAADEAGADRAAREAAARASAAQAERELLVRYMREWAAGGMDAAALLAAARGYVADRPDTGLSGADLASLAADIAGAAPAGPTSKRLAVTDARSLFAAARDQLGATGGQA